MMYPESTVVSFFAALSKLTHTSCVTCASLLLAMLAFKALTWTIEKTNYFGAGVRAKLKNP
jgi:hypothetical protein